MSIRILVVDDHPMIRAGIKAMLAKEDMKVVAEASSGPDAVKIALKKKLDLVLMDVRMPGGDGLNALGRIRLETEDLPIIMYSGYDNPAYVARAVALGANGYVFKCAKRKELISAIKKAVAGEVVWTRNELRRIAGALATPRLGVDIDVSLTQREVQVVKYLVDGMSNKEISDEMDISYETVKEHVQHILRKVGVTDRTQAAVWALRNELV
jgi:DNA-binding NarL/FixJ family response regulator